MMKNIALLTVFLAAVLAAGLGLRLAVADDPKPDDQEMLTDAMFVKLASEAALAEVEFSKVALERASAADVEKFANQMIEDHTTLGNELVAIAQRKNLPGAKELGPDHQAMREQLAKLTGPDFDKAYAAGQLREHEEAVALFGRFAKSGKDPELRDFAAKTLPLLERHLAMSRDLASKVGGGK